MRPDAVGVLVDPGQALGRDEVAVGAMVADRDEVCRVPRRRLDQLDDREPGPAGQAPQDGGLEGHEGHPRPRVVEAVASEVRSSGSSSGSPIESWWVACLSSSMTPTVRPRRARLGTDHGQHLGQRRDTLGPVVVRVGRTRARHPLARGEGLELGDGEVLDEPPALGDAVDGAGGAEVGELGTRRDVGRRAELGVVAGDQDAVPGGDEVELDVVDAHPDGCPVGVEGVLGTVTAGAAVRNHGRRDDQRRGRPERPSRVTVTWTGCRLDGTGAVSSG